MTIMNRIKKELLIKRLKKLCFCPIYFAGCEIYRLLGYKTLQDMVVHIKKGTVTLATPLLFGRRTISNEKKFMYILNKYIMFIRDNFFIRSSEFIMILEETLESPYSEILFSLIEFNKDENYKIFYTEFKKMFLSQLFLNYRKFAVKNISNKDLLSIADLSLDNEKDLDKIFKFFKKVINFRNNDLYCFFVDSDNNNEYREELYTIKWATLINEYINSNIYKYLS